MNKRAISLFLAMLMCLSLAVTAGAAPEDAKQVGDFWVTGNAVLTGYAGSGGDVVIPKGITSIEADAFRNANGKDHITSVVIPEGVTSIANQSFAGCAGLRQVTIPASVQEIGEDAFRGVSDGLIIHGQAGSCAETFAKEHGFQFAADIPSVQISAVPTASTVQVDGETVNFDAYNIGGANYFKLRDLAYVLNGTQKQFAVEWNASANAISLISGQPYEPVGGEMTAGNGTAPAPVRTTSKILLNGAAISLDAYNIGGNNYFKLRDVGVALNFGVDWDAGANTVIISTSKGYTPVV